MEKIETNLCHEIDENSGDVIGNTPNWTDEFGDGCEWYQMSDLPGCPELGDLYEGPNGVANDHCCWCKLTMAPSPSATIEMELI